MPADGLRVGLFHAFTGVITHAEGKLGLGIALLRGLAEPLGGLCVGLLHALAVGITHAKRELCLGILRFRLALSGARHLGRGRRGVDADGAHDKPGCHASFHATFCRALSPGGFIGEGGGEVGDEGGLALGGVAAGEEVGEDLAGEALPGIAFAAGKNGEETATEGAGGVEVTKGTDDKGRNYTEVVEKRGGQTYRYRLTEGSGGRMLSEINVESTNKKGNTRIKRLATDGIINHKSDVIVDADGNVIGNVGPSETTFSDYYKAHKTVDAYGNMSSRIPQGEIMMEQELVDDAVNHAKNVRLEREEDFTLKEFSK